MGKVWHAGTFSLRAHISGKYPLALASVADLCCLEISSRTRHSTESWSIILKVCHIQFIAYNETDFLVIRVDNYCMVAHPFAGAGERQEPPFPSETYSIMSVSMEFIGIVLLWLKRIAQLPIRRRSHPSSARTIELVKREIEVYALVFPDVSFSLESTGKAKENAELRQRSRILTIPRVSMRC